MTRLFSVGGTLSGIALLSLLAAGTSHAQYGPYDPQPGYYSEGSHYAVEHARRAGYQDGVADGQRDRATGHSFRPTQSERYEDASDHGDRDGLRRDDFKNFYRQSYLRGYERGYQEYGYGGGYRRHNRDDDDDRD